METSKPTVAELFGQQRRFVVPIYQRQYVWNAERHWSYLWDDVKRKTLDYLGPDSARSMATHFMGALVLLPQPAVRNVLPYKEVIDGQQRITTMQVLLAAIRDTAVAMGLAAVSTDLRRLTLNDGLMENPEIERWKVWPTDSDQEHFVGVMEAGSRQEVERQFPARREGRRLIPPAGLPGAYLYFYDELANFLTKNDDDSDLPPEEASSRIVALLRALQNRFQFVCIDLDPSDDPQVIFEALNGRGEPLLPSDLIKNYLFQRAQQVGGNIPRMYQAYWREFDSRETENGSDGEAPPQRFWRVMERQGRLERPRIDLYLFHFLQCKQRKEILITELFKEFKEWWVGTPAGTVGLVEERVKDLRVEGDLFAEFFEPKRITTSGQHLYNLKAMDTSTIYPLLLFLFGEAKRAGRVNERELDGILQMLESYLVRRFVGNMTTKQYNRLFLQLLKNLSEGSAAITAEGLRQQLQGLNGVTVEWPSDQQFRKNWLSMPIYSSARTRATSMILSAIDQALFGSATEPVRISYEKLWIEHVIPQKWRAYWSAGKLNDPEIGAWVGSDLTDDERRDVVLHTFGNLTLLTDKLNRDISNGPYTSKRPDITKQSALRLNAYFQDRMQWNEDEIVERGKSLFTMAIKLWPGPA